MSTVPPRSRAPKRPWYLVAALVAGWVLGATAMNEGCTTVAFYRGEPVDVRAQADGISETETRDKVIALNQRYLDTLDAAKNRALPLGIASLLLGAAMVMLSARAMSGRPGARGTLVQVTLVRAALVVTSYFATADVRRTEIDMMQARTAALYHEQAVQHEKPIDKQADDIFQDRILPKMGHVLPPLGLAFSSFVSLFVVIALTRARARQFFEAAAGSLPER